jgi:3-oxoacyl-(acyl-carrier-protein) synthase
MMYGLCTEGMKAINSYVATAWFPAAPQGEISILLRLAGYSKTVAADRISAGFALDQALRSLAAGRVELMLAGGAEAPLSALVLNAHIEARGPAGQNGTLLGEGAALLAIERRDRARTRRVSAYAEIVAAASGPTLADAMGKCMSRAGVPADAVDHVLLDAADHPGAAPDELAALHAIFGDRDGLRISAPKTMYGDLLGAGMALDVASGSLGLARQRVLPSAAGERRFSGPHPYRHVVGAAEACRIRHVLVNGRDQDGRGFAVLLGRDGS